MKPFGSFHKGAKRDGHRRQQQGVTESKPLFGRFMVEAAKEGAREYARRAKERAKG